MSGDQLDLDAIEALAHGATPGPWTLYCGREWFVMNDGRDIGFGEHGEDDAAFVAGVDPATTLALVAEVRRLRDENERAWQQAMDQGAAGAEQVERAEAAEAERDRLAAQVDQVRALTDELDDVLADYAGKPMPYGGTWPGASIRTDVLSQRLRAILDAADADLS